MTGDLAPGFFSSDDELLEMAKSVASVRPGKGVFQCISQMTSNSRGLLPPGVDELPEHHQGLEDPAALIRPDDGTHRGMVRLDLLPASRPLALSSLLLFAC